MEPELIRGQKEGKGVECCLAEQMLSCAQGEAVPWTASVGIFVWSLAGGSAAPCLHGVLGAPTACSTPRTTLKTPWKDPSLGSRVPAWHNVPAPTALYLQVLGALGAVLHSPTLLQRWTEVCCYCFLQLVQVTVHFLQPCQKLAALN